MIVRFDGFEITNIFYLLYPAKAWVVSSFPGIRLGGGLTDETNSGLRIASELLDTVQHIRLATVRNSY